MKRNGLFFAILAFFIIFSFSPAFAANEIQKNVGDLKIFEGTWHGEAYLLDGQNVPVIIYIKSDGSYKAYGQGAGSFMVAGQLTLADGKILFSSSRSQGTITFHANGKTEMLKFWSESGRLGGEYERIK